MTQSCCNFRCRPHSTNTFAEFTLVFFHLSVTVTWFEGLRLRVSDLRFRAEGLGFGGWDSEFQAEGLRLGGCGLGFGVWGLGFGVWGVGCRVYDLDSKGQTAARFRVYSFAGP